MDYLGEETRAKERATGTARVAATSNSANRVASQDKIKGSGDESRRPCDSILRQLKAKANAKAAHVRVEVALGSSLSS